MDNTISLWQAFAENDPNQILLLENHDHQIVGSINLAKWFNYSGAPILTETNLLDRYYLYVPDLGLGIYFSYYKKQRT